MEGIHKEDWLSIPNLLTISRIALLPLIVRCFQSGNMSGALIIYLIAMLTDAADGLIARRTNRITVLGKLLDPLADKLCLLTLLMLFSADNQIPLWLLNLVMMKEAALVLGSAVALRMGIVVSALPIGKLATLTFILSTVSRFLAWRFLGDVLLWLSLGLSLVALGWYGVVLIGKVRFRSAIA